MAKFGFACIDTGYCGQTKEQALALTEQPRHGATAARDSSAEGTLYAGGGSAAVRSVQLASWTHTCFIMYCTNVTFPFTTLRSGRGLVMRFVQLARGSSLHW